MAFDTTERRVYFVMTNQAVGHMRKHGWTDFIRSVETAVTRRACIGRVQVGTRDVGGLAEIRSRIDRLSNRSSNAWHFHMKRMVELRDGECARSLDRFGILVATRANGRVRQKVIFCLNTFRSARVAYGAGQLLLKMNSVRKGRCRNHRNREQQQPGYFP